MIFSISLTKKKKGKKNMVGNFSGQLLHIERIPTDILVIPQANLATGNNEQTEVEHEVFPAAFFKLGQTKLPILKSLDISIITTGGTAQLCSNDGRFQIIVRLYNADADDYDDANLLGTAQYMVADRDSAATISMNTIYEAFHKNFGENNGILLRPTITAVLYIDNNSGAQIDAEEFYADITMTIDWIDVSEQELEEYLKELWLAEEFD